jgi:hypothetical protein
MTEINNRSQRSNVIPFAVRSPASFHPAFKDLSMPELRHALGHAKGYLIAIQTEINNRSQKKGGIDEQ